jgi:alanyl-tRNA synthetase
VADECGAALVQRAQELTKPSPADVSTGLAELQNTLTTATIPVRHRARLRELMEELQHVVKQQQKAHAADAGGVVRERVAELLAQAEKIGDTTVVVGEMPDVPVEQLKHGADTIKQKCGSAAILIGVRVPPSEDGKAPAKALLLAGMTDDLVKRGLKAGDLVKAIAPIVEGGGGGPPTMAQAGGKKPDKLAEALAAGRQWIRGKLA